MIVLMGIAGSGKGTQGKLLADRCGFHWISTGEILRLYITGESRQRMLAGELLDDQAIINVLDIVLKSLKDKDEIVLDGFPRTIPQAEWLLAQAKAGRFNLTQVFHLTASTDAVKSRLIERGRPDDHDKAIEARFKEYETSTLPILEWFKKEQVPVVDINAERPVSEVHEDIVKQLKI